MAPPTDLERALSYLARGDVRSAVPLVGAARAETPAQAVQLELAHAQVLMLTGFATDAAERSHQALRWVSELDDDALEVETLLVHARIRSFQRSDRDVPALLDRALSLAPRRSGAWALVRVRQAIQDVNSGRFERAEQRLHDAIEVYTELGLEEERAHAHLQLGYAAVRRGELDEALPWLLRGQQVFDRVQLRGWRGAAYTLLAQRAWLAGEVDQSEAYLAEAVSVYQRLGMSALQGDCAVNRAEILRSSGRLEEAREQYRRLSLTGSATEHRLFAQLNLALVELQLGRPAEAARLAEGLLQEAEGSLGWLDAVIHLLALAGRIGRGTAAWQAVDAARMALAAAGAVREDDLVLVLREVGGMAEAHGEWVLAGRVWGMALDHLHAVGQETGEEADEARAALGRLRARGVRPWLGEVQLQEVLGTGGMGVVWRGVDHRSGEAVAVKVIRAAGHEPDEVARAGRSLRQELRRVASLSHPHIVDVLDTGEVSAAAACLSDGELVQGSPWVTMELVDGGTLRNLRGRVTWPVAEGILHQLLQALAHAHAASLIHLDLKPRNVLLRQEGGEWVVRLTDFGISRGFRDRVERPLNQGTPRYMAPEQLRGRWREVGPWTDLYALGCVATELLCGRAPFRGDVEQLTAAHLHDKPPPLRAVCPVPAGLEGWIGRLLCKHPMDRFLRVADAAEALRRLEGQPLEAGPGAGDLEASSAEGGVAETFTWEEEPAEGPSLVEPDAPGQDAAEPTLAHRIIATCPPDLPTPATGRGRGLSMLPFRAPDVSARSQELSWLWSALHEVATNRRALWVEVEGVPGVAVEALCRELVRRAHEVGASSALMTEPGQAVESAAAQLLGPVALRGEALQRHLRWRGRAWGVDDATLKQLAHSLEAQTVLEHAATWLSAVTRERPLIWVVADPPTAVREVLHRLAGRPWAFLAVSWRDPLAGRATPPAPRTLSVEPVPDEVLREELSVPRMTATLRWEVAELVEGCEAEVRPLLLHNARRGRLVERPGGVQRRHDERGELLVPVSTEWNARVRQWRADVPASTWSDLEQVCTAPEPVPGRLLADEDALAATGWVRPTGDAWLPRVSALRHAVRRLMLDEGTLQAVAARLIEADCWTAHGHAVLCQWSGRPSAAEEGYRRVAALAEHPVQRRVAWRRWERMARQLGMMADDPRWVEGQALRPAEDA